MKLTDQWVLITGAAKRIGRTIALEFARQGCHILLHYHQSSSDALQTAEDIQQLGRRAELLQLDLTDLTLVKNWMEQNPTQLQKCAVLIHSASLFYPTSPTAPLSERQIFQAIHSDTPLMISRAFAQSKSSASSLGVILNITDAMIEKPYSGYADYFSSKASLQEQTRTLSVEYAPHVRVNSVAPGCVLFPDDYDEVRKNELLKSVPLRREGTPQDIANACVFLAQQDYITGQTLKVDGGRSLA